ncbi:carboxypeptidase-like regulatory domain-containing protein [Chitinophaga sp. NPDC101104]|uniref:carboxypeptidase-like regulatory domain-containing protein n=1 Tax=Chitinophaga sp. NPDC101104 TaxID=3390561 RepID=UPI003CFCF720
MKLYFLLTAFFLLIANVYAQTVVTLRGTVKDAGGKPLPFASVFLNQTTMGARTTESGNYEIGGVPSGRYEVIASYLGYEPQILPLELVENRTLDIVLKEKPGVLKELVVRPDKDREYYMQLFKKVFIGEGAAAQQCKLLNPDRVEFEYDRGTMELKAKADDFLEVSNPSLGYHIRFLLIHFEHSPGTGYSMYYGNPLFEPMKPRSKAQQKRWEKNREKAYRGSALHFCRSLIAGSYRDEGFTMRKLVRRQKEQGQVVQAPPDSVAGIMRSPMFSRSVSYLGRKELPVDSVLQKSGRDYVLRFSDHLYVVYGKEKEERLYIEKYLRSNDKPGPQVSIMKLLAPEVRMDGNGNLEAPMDVIFENYWAWEKLAVMLPLDYRL